MPKFFVDKSQIQDGFVTLRGNDASHISYSLRMAKGEHISVCDGEEQEYDCVLVDFQGDCVTAEIVAMRVSDNESPVRVYLYQALPKGDKLESVIQKAVECGVYEIIPFESERCVVRAKAEAEDKKQIRRNRIAEEAAKQCGRGRIPTVEKTVSFKEAIRKAAEAELCLICYEDEKGTTLKQVLEAADTTPSSISIMIGSEGGFAASEVKAAVELGLRPVSLGRRILRTETAPVFVLSNISYKFEL
ncbi:MAG: 16S rRNA (uracil(1498)-N(3))-methyltransferase [Clostridia bacterium]|nr:16S rRNA (uracil(1498)-N(3))-methyltransferase [Clostridia bacterium]